MPADKTLFLSVYQCLQDGFYPVCFGCYNRWDHGYYGVVVSQLQLYGNVNSIDTCF